MADVGSHSRRAYDVIEGKSSEQWRLLEQKRERLADPSSCTKHRHLAPTLDRWREQTDRGSEAALGRGSRSSLPPSPLPPSLALRCPLTWDEVDRKRTARRGARVASRDNIIGYIWQLGRRRACTC